MKIFKQSQNYPLLMKLQTQLHIGRLVSPDGTSSEVTKNHIFEFPAKILLSAKYYFSSFKKYGGCHLSLFISGTGKGKNGQIWYLQKGQSVLFKKCLVDFWCNAQFHGKILIWKQNSYISRLREKKCTQQNFEKSWSTVQKVSCRWCCSSLGHLWFNWNNVQLKEQKLIFL